MKYRIYLNPSVGEELFNTDGGTHITKLKFAFHIFAKASKNLP